MSLAIYDEVEKFLSTPSARRATARSCLISSLSSYFYPRPPRGGRLLAMIRKLGRCLFLSTPSARRATFQGDPIIKWINYFYPRPPRGGRPKFFQPTFQRVCISIHALREEGDSKNREKTLCFCLIIHLSAQIAKRCL